jgi:hypothetical protein
MIITEAAVSIEEKLSYVLIDESPPKTVSQPDIIL